LEPGITRRDVMAAKVMSILKQSNDLPTLPSVANQIFSIASDPNSSATELADLISRDPALTSKLLKTVNSAFYGSPQKISSVKYAISLLGTEEIVDLSFGLAAANRSGRRKSVRFQISEGDYQSSVTLASFFLHRIDRQVYLQGSDRSKKRWRFLRRVAS